MKSADQNIYRAFDGVGITLSALCLAHCLLLPVALALLPVLSFSPALQSLHDKEWLHLALLLPILVISGPALWRGTKYNPLIGYTGAAGIAALCLALAAPSEWMEQAVTAAGTMLLIAAHILNIRGRASA